MKRIILSACIAIAALLLVGCGDPREVLSVEDFTSIMTAAGHEVEDVTEIFAGMSNMEAMVIADAGDFAVEFIVYETEEMARILFDAARQDLVAGRSGVSSHRETNLANFSRFIQTTAGRFEAIVRVENTIVVILTTADNRDDAEAALELLGY